MDILNKDQRIRLEALNQAQHLIRISPPTSKDKDETESVLEAARKFEKYIENGVELPTTEGDAEVVTGQILSKDEITISGHNLTKGHQCPSMLDLGIGSYISCISYRGHAHVHFGWVNLEKIGNDKIWIW